MSSASPVSERIAVEGILIPDAILTIEGVWKACGLGPDFLREARRAGSIEAIVVGRRVFYRSDDLIRLIESHSKKLKAAS